MPDTKPTKEEWLRKAHDVLSSQQLSALAKLVEHLAEKHSTRALSISTLKQQGFLGMIESVHRWRSNCKEQHAIEPMYWVSAWIRLYIEEFCRQREKKSPQQSK